MFERGELTHADPSWRRARRVLAVWLPAWFAPMLLLWILGGLSSVWTQIGGFFSVMAVVTFGGAYAVLAYVAQAAVETFGWLAPGEMVDGLGLAETTPGPLILVTQFVGFIAAFRSPGPFDPVKVRRHLLPYAGPEDVACRQKPRGFLRKNSGCREIPGQDRIPAAAEDHHFWAAECCFWQ
jgi:hypothetical protein